MAQRRRARAQKETNALLCGIPPYVLDQFDGIIQCGLGDWAEGPVLLEAFPPKRYSYLAVEPIPRFCFEAWAAGFRGPIIQGALWKETGGQVSLQDFRSRTSMLDTEPRRGEVKARLLTLDDAVTYSNFSANGVLLWMDCEGVELTILQGAAETLKKTPVIICELKDEPKMANWPPASAIIQQLNSLGYYFIDRVSDNGLFFKK
jgi:FkbM family methyltransferase